MLKWRWPEPKAKGRNPKSEIRPWLRRGEKKSEARLRRSFRLRQATADRTARQEAENRCPFLCVHRASAVS